MTTPTTVNVQIQLRADTAANWTAANPTLLANEVGLETDTKKLKVGDGTTAWGGLAYFPSIVTGGTVLGNLEIGSTGTLTFEGSTADGFETTLAVTNPTADRTITLPNQSGTVVVSGNASIVDADIAAGAEIAVSKLANGTANQVIVTDGTNVSWSDDLTLAGNLTVNGTTTTINTQDLLVEDKNIIIGNVDTPTDVTADGGGITLKGATDKTINWYDATDAWTSSERFSVPLGSAASPSLTFTGDENTGIYSPGADQVALSTNGTQRINIEADGDISIDGGGVFYDATNNRLGIGTSTPLRTLTSAGTSGELCLLGTGAEGTENALIGRISSQTRTFGASISNSSFASIEFRTSGSPWYSRGAIAFRTVSGDGTTEAGVERMRITSTGVGIGTTSPNATLHVNGASTLGGTVSLLRNTDTTSTLRYGSLHNQYSQSSAGSTSHELYTCNTGYFSNNIFTTGALNFSTEFVTAGSGQTRTSFAVRTGRVQVGAGAVNTVQNRLSVSAYGTTTVIAETAISPFVANIGASEVARIDGSGRLLVGTSSARAVELPTSTGGVSTAFNVEGILGNNDNYPGIVLTRNADNTSNFGPFITMARSRGNTLTSNTLVGADDNLGAIVFAGADGTDIRTKAATISAFVDGTPGANDMPGRLVFSTTADGASSPTERMRISNNGFFDMPGVYNFTTANAANVNVDATGGMRRSTSSGKYKTDIETLEDSYADALLDCRPVWYRSTCEIDNPNHGWWGFIAEEVAEIDPRLVHWKTVEVTYGENGSAVQTPCDPEPEGVQYDRFVPHLLNLIKRQKEQIEAMEARLTALESA